MYLCVYVHVCVYMSMSVYVSHRIYHTILTELLFIYKIGIIISHL